MNEVQELINDAFKERLNYNILMVKLENLFKTQNIDAINLYKHSNYMISYREKMVSPLFWAIKEHDKYNLKDFYRNLSQIKKEDIISLILEKEPSDRLLDFLKFVVSKGYDLNKKVNGWNAITTAASFSFDWFNILLDNFQEIDVNATGENNVSAASIIISMSNRFSNRSINSDKLFLSFKRILKLGADPNIQEKTTGDTLLHDIVTYLPEKRVIKELMKYKPDIYIKNKNNQNALEYAIQRNKRYYAPDSFVEFLSQYYEK